MKIVILGAGVQGTVYAARLALAGHDVTLVARHGRGAELRERGAVIQHVTTGRRDVVHLPVIDALTADTVAALGIIAVRREQRSAVLPDVASATGVERVLLLGNCAAGSQPWLDTLGRQRLVLGFPGVTGETVGGVARYAESRHYATLIEAFAPDVASVVRSAGFRVRLVRHMDAWLCRHAVVLTALSAALYQVDGDPRRLASVTPALQALVAVIRNAQRSLDRRGMQARGWRPPIMRSLVPASVVIAHWRRRLRSESGDGVFAPSARYAPEEMAALAVDVLRLMAPDATTELRLLYGAIGRASRLGETLGVDASAAEPAP